MANTTPHLAQKTRYSVRTTLVLYCSLLMLICTWNLTRSNEINWPIWAIQALPLLMLLPGLAKQHYRTYIWLCFLLLFYFIRGVESVFISTASLDDWLFLTLIISLFISSMLTSRWLQRFIK